MVPGMIMLWYGSKETIPSGWTLCDGTMGTPDLRDKFVVGPGAVFDVGDSGGAFSHNHTFTGDGHAHSPASGIDFSSAAPVDLEVAPSSVTGTTNLGSGIPPYHCLAYIMKL